MRIGIIVAMTKELNLLLPLMSDATAKNIDGFTLHFGKIGNKDVCIMQCGIGKVNAALGCRAMIAEFAPRLIINTGVAGGTGSAAKVLDIAVATAVGYHDVWCGPGTQWGQAADCPRLLPCATGLLTLPELTENPGVKFGVIASGDIFVDRRSTVDLVLELYPDAVGVDMESGAIAQTCHRFGVPFICLRVISDTPGEVSNNGDQYDSFWEAAPAETFAIVKSLIEKL